MTLDEEANLPHCLASIAWCDDIVILDSCSQDRTQHIAKDANTRIFERPFDNYAAQRNFGLKNITYKYQWVLMVDADEEVTPELATEIKEAIGSCGSNTTLFRMRRKDHFFGKWIRRSSGYPTWFGRLVRPDRVHVEREINEEFVTDGTIALLQHHLNHYPFNKGFSAWLEKHNRYSTMEAELIVKQGLMSLKLGYFLDNDPATRRKALKALVYRMPGRPLLMFLALYIVRGGFLDGKAGFTFCILRSIYEFLINCKVKELRLRARSLPL
jgi:glycosyltransferase involved in cell wall biosynthesis